MRSLGPVPKRVRRSLLKRCLATWYHPHEVHVHLSARIDDEPVGGRTLSNLCQTNDVELPSTEPNYRQRGAKKLYPHCTSRRGQHLPGHPRSRSEAQRSMPDSVKRSSEVTGGLDGHVGPALCFPAYWRSHEAERTVAVEYRLRPPFFRYRRTVHDSSTNGDRALSGAEVGA